MVMSSGNRVFYRVIVSRQDRNVYLWFDFRVLASWVLEMKKMNFHYLCDLSEIILETFYKSPKFLTRQFTTEL